MTDLTFDEIVSAAQELSAEERAVLVERLQSTLENGSAEQPPTESLLGK